MNYLPPPPWANRSNSYRRVPSGSQPARRRPRRARRRARRPGPPPQPSSRLPSPPRATRASPNEHSRSLILHPGSEPLPRCRVRASCSSSRRNTDSSPSPWASPPREASRRFGSRYEPSGSPGSGSTKMIHRNPRNPVRSCEPLRCARRLRAWTTWPTRVRAGRRRTAPRRATGGPARTRGRDRERTVSSAVVAAVYSAAYSRRSRRRLLSL